MRGTHNAFAPPFDFVSESFCPIVNRLGVKISMELERPGFYPAGGGRFSALIKPTKKLIPVHLLERGETKLCEVIALINQLDPEIAKRELVEVKRLLDSEEIHTNIYQTSHPNGSGNVLLLKHQYDWGSLFSLDLVKSVNVLKMLQKKRLISGFGIRRVMHQLMII